MVGVSTATQGSEVEEIRTGDVVYLKSGGPAMVVSVLFDMEGVPSKSEDKPEKMPAAQCEWFANNHGVWLPTSYAEGYALVTLTKKNPSE